MSPASFIAGERSARSGLGSEARSRTAVRSRVRPPTCSPEHATAASCPPRSAKRPAGVGPRAGPRDLLLYGGGGGGGLEPTPPLAVTHRGPSDIFSLTAHAY